MTEATGQRETAVALLRAFGAADSRLGREFAKQQHMHPTDAAAIVEILDAESRDAVLTPARLADRIGLTAGATSSVVNRLEAAGHVVRTRDHRDRRVVELHSTPRVHEDAAAFFSPVSAALDEALAGCTPDELDALVRTLTVLNDVVQRAGSRASS
jgi:MarR family transcriptional regulator, organic hydroperoxide resistance regulator